LKKLFSVRIAAFGDPHLTNNLPYTILGSSYRKERLKKYLDYSFKVLVKKKVDLIVVPGDICHTTNLDSNDLDLLMHFLEVSRISKIPTVIIPGNHDKDQELCILQFLDNYKKNSPNIVYSQETVSAWIFEFETNIRIVGIGFCSDEDFLKNAKNGMVHLGSDKKFYNVLIAHVGIKGTLHGSTKSIHGIKKEDLIELEKGYDLMIFAHHHLTQKITSKSFYCGSIHQTRIDERDHVPGVVIFDLPDIKIRKIENKFSPRFKLIEDYTIKPEEVEGNIVKPIIDPQKFSEEEHLSFIKEILEYNPYYLIRPSLKKAYKPEGEVRLKKEDSKQKVLKRVMKESSGTLSKKRTKKFNKHVLSLYDEIKNSLN